MIKINKLSNWSRCRNSYRLHVLAQLSTRSKLSADSCEITYRRSRHKLISTLVSSQINKVSWASCNWSSKSWRTKSLRRWERLITKWNQSIKPKVLNRASKSCLRRRGQMKRLNHEPLAGMRVRQSSTWRAPSLFLTKEAQPIATSSGMERLLSSFLRTLSVKQALMRRSDSRTATSRMCLDTTVHKNWCTVARIWTHPEVGLQGR